MESMLTTPPGAMVSAGSSMVCFAVDPTAGAWQAASSPHRGMRHLGCIHQSGIELKYCPSEHFTTVGGAMWLPCRDWYSSEAGQRCCLCPVEACLDVWRDRLTSRLLASGNALCDLLGDLLGRAGLAFQHSTYGHEAVERRSEELVLFT